MSETATLGVLLRFMREARHRNGPGRYRYAQSQTEIAQRIGVSQATVSRIERGLHDPPWGLVAAWCMCCNLTMAQLVARLPHPLPGPEDPQCCKPLPLYSHGTIPCELIQGHLGDCWWQDNSEPDDDSW